MSGARAEKESWPPLSEVEGWGRYPKGQAQLLNVQTIAETLAALQDRKGLSVIGRGSGRAYGDAAMNTGQLCLGFQPMDRFLSFDPRSGSLHAEAGVTLEQVLETFIPQGWFLPVTPGTKYPTLGGSVACDVHGKSHAPISQFLERLHLLLADGSQVSCSPTERPELFWATTGGMGLTGLILSVELKLLPIESSYIHYQGVKAKNLEGIFSLFEAADQAPLSVAWIDGLAKGRSLGRSILMQGSFAKGSELKGRPALSVMHKLKVAVPFDLPAFSLNHLSITAFNAFIYGKHPQRLVHLEDYDTFFYPLDSVLHWNRIYGRPGLVQYQFLIPPKESFDGIRTVLEAIARSGQASFLAVLKKFGDLKNPGMLSFPAPGYFLALDFPVGNGEILKHMDAWDELVLKFGGRLYLAKDSRMRSATFQAMYPRLAEWKRIKAQVDPGNVFVSDQARRLGLV